MAYIVNKTSTDTATGATYAVDLGDHVSGDLLLIKLSQDGGGTEIAPDSAAATAGWQMIGTQAQSAVQRSVWAYLVADSASETNPTFTGANDDWIGTAYTIRDAGATPIANWQRTDWTTVSTIGSNTGIAASSNSGSAISVATGSLLLYSWSSDGSTMLRCKANQVVASELYESTAVGHIVTYSVATTSGTVPEVTMYAENATEGGNGWVLEIANSTGGTVQPVSFPDIDEWYWGGYWYDDHNVWGTSYAANDIAASILGITCSATAYTVAAGSQGLIGGYWGSYYTGWTVTDTTNPVWTGAVRHFPAIDLTGKILKIDNQTQNLGRIGSYGLAVIFADSTGNWVTYQTADLDQIRQFEMAFAHVALGQTTPLASSGSINWADITKLGFIEHRVGGVATGNTMKFRQVYFAGPQITCIGGGADSPASFVTMAQDVLSWDAFRLADVFGSGAVMLKQGVQIGNGSSATYFDSTSQAMTYPYAPALAPVKSLDWWDCTENDAPFTIKLAAGDTCILAGAQLTAPSKQPFTIDAASSTSATYNFAGAVLTGWDVTWKTGVECQQVTFSGCYEIQAKGADFTGCIITGPLAGATEAAIAFDTSGATMDNCTIDVTGTAAGYHIELGASVTAVTLTDVTFTGAPGTDKVHVPATSGTVTITIDGTTSLVAGDVTSAGATVVIDAPTLVLTVAANISLSGAEVRIYDNEVGGNNYGTELSGTESCPGATYAYSGTGGNGVIIQIMLAGYVEFTQAYTLPTTSATFTAILTPDTNA